jgi:hypothetical protein
MFLFYSTLLVGLGLAAGSVLGTLGMFLHVRAQRRR